MSHSRARKRACAKNPPPGALLSVFTFSNCGCQLEFHVGDAPVRVWECEHGNYFRAVGA